MNPLQELELRWPIDDWGRLVVLVAVSGGADSVALLRLLKELKQQHAGETNLPGQLVVAHFDHGMRDDSANDTNWVKSLANEMKLPCVVERASDLITSEQSARNARYRFLEQAASDWGARYIALGHTADDQAETILHRVIRGTGVAGLAGMPRARALNPSVSLIRPFLRVRRQTLRDYLDGLGQAYLEDATNRDTAFTRNRIRNELIPHLQQHYNPDVISALNRLGILAAATQSIITQQVEQLSQQSVQRPAGNQVIVDTTKLNKVSNHLVRELLVHIWNDRSWPMQDMSFEKLSLLADFVTNTDPSSKPMEVPGGIRVERQGNRVVFTG